MCDPCHNYWDAVVDFIEHIHRDYESIINFFRFQGIDGNFRSRFCCNIESDWEQGGEISVVDFYWHFVDQLLTLCWPFIDPLLTICWPFVYLLLTLFLPFVDLLLTDLRDQCTGETTELHIWIHINSAEIYFRWKWTIWMSTAMQQPVGWDPIYDFNTFL